MISTKQQDKLIEAAQNAIEFDVQGRGEFPVDMLRYDLCWPATETDSNLIDPPRVAGLAKQRIITLRSLKGTPTFARWRSFGWEVLWTDQETYLEHRQKTDV